MQPIKITDPTTPFNMSAVMRSIDAAQECLDGAAKAGLDAINETKKSAEFGKTVSELVTMASGLYGPRGACLWFVTPEAGIGYTPAQQIINPQLRGPFVQRFTQYATTEGMRKLASALGM